MAIRVSAVDRAIATVEASRETHVQWIAWLLRHGRRVPAEARRYGGDVRHHRRVVHRYDHVLEVLHAARERSTY